MKKKVLRGKRGKLPSSGNQFSKIKGFLKHNSASKTSYLEKSPLVTQKEKKIFELMANKNRTCFSA